MQDKRSYLAECLSSDSDVVQQGLGKNIIQQPKKKSLWLRYLEKFTDPIIIVLLVVFAFSIIVNLYEIFSMGRSWAAMLDSFGVLVALLLATGIGFVFEVRAEKEFDILNQVKNDRPVLVYRRKRKGQKSRLCRIKKCDVVVGDIVKIESGDEIPADGVLLDSLSLRIDESVFTGELYANKTANESDFDKEATYPSNSVLRGTTVIDGHGIYRVTAVGMETEEGKGAIQVQEGSSVQTPLNKQLDQLGRAISIASFVIAGLIVIGRLIYYFAVLHQTQFVPIEFVEYVLGSIMLAVTLIVVAVPEGLPMSITVSLALSMRKMLKEKNLVRKLHACETMGATTVICTDKTGTLTKNEMTVMKHQFYADDELVYQNMAINSTAELTIEEGKIVSIGNPTEGALLRWMEYLDVGYLPYRESAKVVGQIPFSSENKMMTTTVQKDDGRFVVYLKGAPELVLDMCGSVADGSSKEQAAKSFLEYQRQAMRTIAFAYQEKESLDEADNFVFVGSVGIADPLREDVAEAINTCSRSAGVRVIIVTGDTSATAEKIATQIGLLSEDGSDIVLTGIQFNQMSDDEARSALRDKRFKILSRARPEDKVRLVELLQKNGEVVAVTGDGTNDAPALSKAQVGLSMGDGTSRAKEASDITIIDNSFSSINKAIMWGRSIYLNIRRFIVFQMTINICACFIVLLGAFTGIDSPLTVTQMLWVNLIMDTFAALALSSLPADKRVLMDKPRNPKSHIIDRKMTYWIVGMGVAFFVVLTGLWQLLWHIDINPSDGVASILNQETFQTFANGFFSGHTKAHMNGYESAIFFTTFVFLQFWNLFNARYYRTGRSMLQDIIAIVKRKLRFKEVFGWGFMSIVAVILIGQILIVNCASQMFHVAPLGISDFLLLLILTSPVLIAVDLLRSFVNAFKNKRL